MTRVHSPCKQHAEGTHKLFKMLRHEDEKVYESVHQGIF